MKYMIYKKKKKKLDEKKTQTKVQKRGGNVSYNCKFGKKV